MGEHLNLDNLRELTDGDEDIEKEIFQDFIESSAQLVDELREHCDGGKDNEAWRKAAHALKGIALNLGAFALGDIAKQAQEIYEQSIEEKTKLFHEIDTEKNLVVSLLHKEGTL